LTPPPKCDARSTSLPSSPLRAPSPPAPTSTNGTTLASGSWPITWPRTANSVARPVPSDSVVGITAASSSAPTYGIGRYATRSPIDPAARPYGCHGVPGLYSSCDRFGTNTPPNTPSSSRWRVVGLYRWIHRSVGLAAPGGAAGATAGPSATGGAGGSAPDELVDAARTTAHAAPVNQRRRTVARSRTPRPMPADYRVIALD
jgi:hypothetical protein